MPRRGRCRCGNILVFHRGPQGYKMRCPRCLAVVRLHFRSSGKSPPRPNGAPAKDFDRNSFAGSQFLDMELDDSSDHGGVP